MHTAHPGGGGGGGVVIKGDHHGATDQGTVLIGHHHTPPAEGAGVLDRAGGIQAAGAHYVHLLHDDH